MNVLITGGRGGLGSAIAEVIAARAGASVVTLGRTRAKQPALRENVVHETGDVTDAGFVDDLLQRHAITHIIHAAGLRTRECQMNPRPCLKTYRLAKWE